MKVIRLIKQNSLLSIFLLALFLRVYNLGEIPVGFHADEVRVGWNAYSILKTGEDDYSQMLGLYYNTFGDFRPSGIFYFTVPFIKIFGLNQFATRVGSALVGALLVFPLFSFTTLILRKMESKKARRVGFFAAFFLSIMPWEIAVSRATSEAVVSSFFLLCGLVSLLKAHKENKTNKYFFAFTFFVVSFLFYHSARLLIPLFTFVSLFYTSKVSTKKSAIMTGAVVSLTVFFLLIPGTLARFNQVSVAKSSQFLYSGFRDQYAAYLSADFLMGNAPKPMRYKINGMNLVGVGLLGLALVGIYVSFNKKGSTLPVWMLLLSPIPAAITLEDSPNLHRTMFMSILFCFFGALGIVHLMNKNYLSKLVAAMLLVVTIASSCSFLLSYFGGGKLDAAPFRSYGTEDLVETVSNQKQSFDKIVLSGDPDSIYPWFAFYTKQDPKYFNESAGVRDNKSWSFENILFSIDKCPSANTLKEAKAGGYSVLVVDAGECEVQSVKKVHETARVQKEIFSPDRKPIFRIWEEIN